MSDERSADDLNAQEAANNPTGENETAVEQQPDYQAPPPPPEPEVGISTPAAGDGPHQPDPSTNSDEFDSAWAGAADKWINGHLRNSPLAEATQAWNHVMAKLPLLGAMVKAAMSSKKE